MIPADKTPGSVDETFEIEDVCSCARRIVPAQEASHKAAVNVR